MTVLIRGGWVLAPEAIADGAVVVEGARIVEVGPYTDLVARYPDAEVHGSAYDIVSPGFVNTHGHFSEGLITGIASDYTLWEWICALINPVSPHLDRGSAYLGTLLSGIQMLRSGVTTANDMFVCHPADDAAPVTPGVVDALEELGLRGVLSFGAGDRGGRSIGRQVEEHDALREAVASSSLQTFRVGIGALGGQSDEMFAASVEYAVGGGHGVHIHMQEIREEVTATFERTGRTVVGHCAHEGLFAAPTLAAHCVWVDRADRALMAEHRVGVAHNPVANMILASGVAPVTEMRQLGIDVGIGVDGAASNDSQDFLQAMKSAALLARVHHQQATAMSAREAWEMATIGGARALRMEATIGTLEAGKQADIVVLDGTGPTLANVHDPYQAVVFVAGSREVKEVWVGGRASLLDFEVTAVDPAEVAARSRPVAADLVRRAGLAHLSVLAGSGSAGS
ncbi:amidohydrolase family protein [Nocardioides sp. cx-173]|uniref:amidohydrolase family protein n=1 Tax=Nocardioides sp. cx-173 TaxID=2898796 RepID=UPI001E40C139|nr:amidohydrolase [Nocardioides sp. cx-173]MCD4524035.1 amidohydrolase [Nocardioides sp. cx-173]UGB41436.1 amidohydrolase [Nocardioides sp. cx-173]